MLKANKYKFSEVPQRYWDFCDRHGTLYQTEVYLRCLDSIGKDLLIIEFMDGEEVVGGAGIILNCKVFNCALSGSLFFGPVVRDDSVTSEVFRCFSSLIAPMFLTFSITVIPEQSEIIRNNCDPSIWNCVDYELLHWDMSKDLDSLWASIPKRKRNYVRSSRKKKLIVVEEIESEEQLKQSYDLHIKSMTRGGVKALAYSYYESLFKILKPRDLFGGLIAYNSEDRKPIATVLLLFGMHDQAFHLSIGYSRKEQKLHAPDVLMWEAIELMKSKNYTLFNMLGLVSGDSAREQGIRKYKLNWAGENGHPQPSVNVYLKKRFKIGLIRRLFSKK